MAQTDTDETWEGGTLKSSTQVQRDWTALNNRTALSSLALQALADNKTFVASTPTAGQTAAQVKALSRQINGLIRLLLGALDATD